MTRELTDLQRAKLEQDERLKTLWKRGDKAEAIAADLGINYQTLRKRCQNLGLPSRLPKEHFIRAEIPTLSERLTDEAHTLWRNGFDTARIAARMNVLEAAVYNSLSNLRSQRGFLSAGARGRGPVSHASGLGHQSHHSTGDVA